MSDIAIQFNPDTRSFDAALFFGDCIADDGLRTAVLVSLFTDREDPDAVDADRRGWWGDTLNTDPADRWGSLLWRLDRVTLTNERLVEAKAYIEQALAWLVEDGVARAVTVTTRRGGDDLLDADIDIDQPNGVQRIRLSDLWEASFVDPFQTALDEANADAGTASLYQHIYFDQLPEITS